MKNISQKILDLQNKRIQLEKELLELKQKAVQDLSGALVHIQDIEKVDTYTIIGSVLKALKSDQKREDLQKAGRTFCRQHKSKISQRHLGRTKPEQNKETNRKETCSGEEK